MSGENETAGEALTSPYLLEYAYKRSTGPVIGEFLTGLQKGRIQGIRTASGRVICPPTEYDPETSEPLSELVEAGPMGSVQSFAWVAAPRARHPRKQPFAFALIKLDGADSSLLHVVDAENESQLSVGARVRARFRDAAAMTGAITDIDCFELIDIPTDANHG